MIYQLLTIIFLVATLGACSKQAPTVKPFSESEREPAGPLTLPRVPSDSFIHPGKDLTGRQKLNFWTGSSLFGDPWVIAPSSTDDRDGLGPLFNTRSCTACHQAGSRSAMATTGETLPKALVMRLGSIDASQPTATDPIYGGQIQPRTINKTLAGEAWLQLNYQIIEGQFADGEIYQLQKPNYQLTQLSSGPLASHIQSSPRYAPSIYGMGLLDAIATKDLLAQEDIDDVNQDGISAKYNRVPNIESGQQDVGRFGLKAKQPTLKQQVAAAFRDDIGITNSLFPHESCTEAQQQCHQAALKDGVEIKDKLLALVVDFNRYIGVPPARQLDSSNTRQGRDLFYQTGCAGCHTPNYITDENYPIEQLANITIWPYSDLALHDMGPELADGVYEYQANGFEWRTPPLWGIGLQSQLLNEPRYLHDGRARNLTEAILWHGGEGEQAKQRFKQLDKQQRQQLLQFLRSI